MTLSSWRTVDKQMTLATNDADFTLQAANFWFKSDDGVEIYVYKWVPEVPARGIVHIVHGLAEHAARYGRTAGRLTASGYVVYAHDLRGHGRTAGSPEKCGNLDGWNRAVADIALLLQSERKAHPTLPMILLGHSMGSFMVQQMMYQNPELLDACALSGSRGKPDLHVYLARFLAFLEKVRIGADGRSTFMHDFSLKEANKGFRPVRTKFDWLSRDSARVDEYVGDPFCGWIGPVQLWIYLTQGLLQIARPENKKRIPADLPVYIFAGTRDPVSDGCKGLKGLIEAYRRAGLTNIRFKFYPEGRHEMLNEINRDEVHADLLEWLDTCLRLT